MREKQKKQKGEVVKMIIDRSKPFNPKKFLGSSEKFEIVEEDKQSLALTEIETTKIFRVHMLGFFIREEPLIRGIVGKKRKNEIEEDKYVCLDAKILQTFLENQQMIPEEWKEIPDNKEKHNFCLSCTFFEGTIIRFFNKENRSCGNWAFFLYWDGHNWGWRCNRSMDVQRYACEPSAVIRIK